MMNWQSSTAAEMGSITARTASTAEVQTTRYSQRRPSWAKQIMGVALTSLSLSVLASGPAEAVSFTFEKVADTSTSIPGAPGNFDAFGGASIDKGDVAFDGYSDLDDNYTIYNQEGIYTSIGGKLGVVADTNTLVPGGQAGNFDGFRSPSLENGTVAFYGYTLSGYDSGGPSGIYTRSTTGGKLNVIADTQTIAPGTTDLFVDFGGPSLSEGNIAFPSDQFVGVGPKGIYTSIGGKLNLIADTNTPIPGGTGNFKYFDRFVALSNGNVAFSSDNDDGVSNGSERGVYASIGGKLNLIANRNTPVPDGTGNFEFVGDPLLDGERVVFIGGSASGDQRGIYTSIEGKLSVIVDTNTPMPDGTGNFEGFDTFSLDSGNIAFLGSPYLYSEEYGNRPGAIYTNVGGELAKVIAIGDRLDGKEITSINLGTEGLSGNQIVFDVDFEDGSENIFSEGIYVATAVPEPASVLGTLAFGAFGAGSMLRRRQKQQRVSHIKGVE